MPKAAGISIDEGRFSFRGRSVLTYRPEALGGVELHIVLGYFVQDAEVGRQRLIDVHRRGSAVKQWRIRDQVMRIASAGI